MSFVVEDMERSGFQLFSTGTADLVRAWASSWICIACCVFASLRVWLCISIFVLFVFFDVFAGVLLCSSLVCLVELFLWLIMEDQCPLPLYVHMLYMSLVCISNHSLITYPSCPYRFCGTARRRGQGVILYLYLTRTGIKFCHCTRLGLPACHVTRLLTVRCIRYVYLCLCLCVFLCGYMRTYIG